MSISRAVVMAALAAKASGEGHEHVTPTMGTWTRVTLYTDAACTEPHEHVYGGQGVDNFNPSSHILEGFCQVFWNSGAGDQGIPEGAVARMHTWNADGVHLDYRVFSDTSCTTELPVYKQFSECEPVTKKNDGWGMNLFNWQLDENGADNPIVLYQKFEKQAYKAEYLVKEVYETSTTAEDGSQTCSDLSYMLVFLINSCRSYAYPGFPYPMGNGATVTPGGQVFDLWYQGASDCNTANIAIGNMHGVANKCMTDGTGAHVIMSGDTTNMEPMVANCVQIPGILMNTSAQDPAYPFDGEKFKQCVDDTPECPLAQMCAEYRSEFQDTWIGSCAAVKAQEMVSGVVSFVRQVLSWCQGLTCGDVKKSFKHLYEGAYGFHRGIESPKECCSAGDDAPSYTKYACHALKTAYKNAECCGMPGKNVTLEHMTAKKGDEGRRLFDASPLSETNDFTLDGSDFPDISGSTRDAAELRKRLAAKAMKKLDKVMK